MEQVIDLNGKEATKDVSRVSLMLVVQYLVKHAVQLKINLVPAYIKIMERFSKSENLDKVILPLTRMLSLTVVYPEVYLQRKLLPCSSAPFECVRED